MMPRMPSEPIIRRSGLGPAPEPGRRRDLDHALRRDDAQRFHEIVDMGVERREMTAAARRDPAAERGIFEALRKMAQREPVRTQLRLQRRAVGAGLDQRGARGLVDLLHLAHAGAGRSSPRPCGRRASARRRRTRSIRRRTASRWRRPIRPSRARRRLRFRRAGRRRRRAHWRSRAQGRARVRDRICRRCARRGRSGRWCRMGATRARVTRGACERDLVEPRRACALRQRRAEARSRAREHEGLFVGGQALALAAPAEVLQPRCGHCVLPARLRMRQ